MVEDEVKSTARTVPELGQELAGFKENTKLQFKYMNEKFDDLNKHLGETNTLLKEVLLGKVDQKDFEAHVTWGETQVALILARLAVAEKWIEKKDNSLFSKIGIILQDRMVQIIALVIIVGFLFVLVKFTQPDALKITP